MKGRLSMAHKHVLFRSEAREKILHSASGASLMVDATNCVRTDSEAFWRLSLSAQANTAASSELGLIRLW